MGKVKTLKERVEWFSDTSAKTCRGEFVQDVGVNFVLEELNNAPVEYSSLDTRIGKTGAYADEWLIVHTNVNLKESDLKRIPFKLVETTETDKTGYKFYKFQVEDFSEQSA